MTRKWTAKLAIGQAVVDVPTSAADLLRDQLDEGITTARRQVADFAAAGVVRVVLYKTTGRGTVADRSYTIEENSAGRLVAFGPYKA